MREAERLLDSGGRSDNPTAEVIDHILDEHSNHRLVFDDQDTTSWPLFHGSSGVDGSDAAKVTVKLKTSSRFWDWPHVRNPVMSGTPPAR
jgi:hypothetical protein